MDLAGSIVFSTYLGGTQEDKGNAITVDASGNAYVAGVTGSTDFPTANAFQPSFGGGAVGDAFVAKIGLVSPSPLDEQRRRPY